MTGRGAAAIRWSAVLGICLAAGCGRGEGKAAMDPAPGAPSAATPPGVIAIASDSPQSRQLRIGTVELAQIAIDEIVAPGRVTTNPNRISRVLPPVGGRVLKVLVKFGDHVEQGQALLTMDSPDGDAAVSAHLQAESAERQTKAALEKADADLRRATDLYEHRAIAEKDLLQARNDQATAQAGYEVAQAVREQTWRKLQLLELRPREFHQPLLVRAPITGQVLEVNVAPAEYRAGISFHTDTTAPLMSIVDLSTVWVAADVPERAAGLVHVGGLATIGLVAFPDEVFTGHVARIGNVLDAQTRTLKVYVELPNPAGRLRPEMFGTVRQAGTPRAVPALPPEAIVQEYGRSTVFAERAPGQYERRPVTVGRPVGERVPVLAGVQAGDRVVVDGAVLLKDR
jgi:cobalt-zinc-cadmium efflux system membrane fusion protein